MSYLQNFKVEYGDSPSIDSFGRARFSQTSQLWGGKNQAYDNDILYAKRTEGGGTITWSNTTGMYTLAGSSSGDKSIFRTRNAFVYQTGKSPQIFITFTGFGGSNSVKRVGLFGNLYSGGNYNNIEGFVLENNKGTVSFKIYNRSSTASETYLQANWEASDFNPSDIDWSAPQIMALDFEWLGVGRIRFGLVIGGSIRYFVLANHANNPAYTSPYITNPNLPITYEMSNSSSSDTFQTICSSYSIEGSINSLGRTFGVSNISGSGNLTSGVLYALLGIRLAEANPFSGLIQQIQSLAVGKSVTEVSEVSLILNPTLSSTPSWSSLESFSIPLEFSAPSLAIGATGGYTLTKALSQGNSDLMLTAGDSVLKPGVTFDPSYSQGYRPDEVWLCARPLSGNISGSANLFASINGYIEI